MQEYGNNLHNVIGSPGGAFHSSSSSAFSSGPVSKKRRLVAQFDK